MRAVLLAVSLAVLARAQTPVINAGGVVNSGNYAGGGVAPGSIASVFGVHLASRTVSAAAIPLATTLGNVESVTFAGVPAPLYFVSDGQINAQVPWNLGLGPVDVIVTTTQGTSAAVSVPIAPAAPGIFAVSANGLGQAVATDNSDGALAAPQAAPVSIPAHPIQIGDYLVVWCTGLGAVDMPVANGADTEGQIVNTLMQPAVLIGGIPATFVYSVLSPQFAGEYQVAVQVPPGAPSGDAVPLQIEINGITTATTVTIAVANPSD